MGMSASQVRFLSLQHRKHDIGRELSTLSNRKMSLSRDMNRVAKNYTNALNQNVLKWSNDSGATYHNLSYGLMMKPNDINTESPCIVSTRGGAVVVDNLNNLTGKIIDENGDAVYLEFDGTNGTSGIIQSSEYYKAVYGDENHAKTDVINYTNIARWITSTPVENGTNAGKVGVVSSDGGVLSGTSNVGSYTIPENTCSYGYQDGLRYQIFQELGLVSENTNGEFANLINKIFGDETAYNFGDYSQILQGFVKEAKSRGFDRLCTDVNLTDPTQVTNAIMIGDKSFGLSENGSHSGFAKYFGYIDSETGTWATELVNGKCVTKGSLMGNLALAQYALTEYDQWLNEMHVLNLGTTTDLTFTASSGRTKTWTLAPVLDMNGHEEASSKTAISNHAEYDLPAMTGDTSARYDDSWLGSTNAENINSNGNSRIMLDANWTSIFADKGGEASTIILKETDYVIPKTVLGFLSGVTGAAHSADGKGQTDKTGLNWVVQSVVGDEPIMVHDVDDDGNIIYDESKMISLEKAAEKYAVSKTIEYYSNIGTFLGNWSGCNSGYVPLWGDHSFNTEWNLYTTNENHVQTVGDDIQNGIGHAYESRCGWHKFLKAIGGFFTMVAGIFETVFTMGNSNSLISTGWNNTFHPTDEESYSLDMNNVLQTYYTFYEMFMASYNESGTNLLTGEGGSKTSTKLTTVVSNDWTTHSTELLAALESAGPSGNAVSGGTVVGTGTIGGNTYNYFAIEEKTETHDDESYTYYVAKRTMKYTSGPLSGKEYVVEDYYNKSEIDPSTGKFVLSDQCCDQAGNSFSNHANLYQAVVSGVGHIVKNDTGATFSKSWNGKTCEYANGTTTIFFETPQSCTSYSVGANNERISQEVSYDQVVIGADGTPKYFLNGSPVTVKNIRAELTSEVTLGNGTVYKIAQGGSRFTNVMHAYVTKDAAFEAKLIKDVEDAKQAIEDAKEDVERFYSAKEMKLMDFYDAIFSRVSQCGWVQDINIANVDYLNAKLENNNFFVTTCRDKVNQNGFTYTTKIAQTITKIYQIHDSNAENQALSEYEEAKSLIQAKEKKVDARMAKLETEQEVINTELESLKKVRDDNISKTFKIFA